MMMMVESYWYFFAGTFSNCYSIAILLLTVFYLLKKKWQNEIINWVYVFNTIMAWTVLLNLLLLIKELFAAWYGQNPYEWYAFKKSETDIFTTNTWGYWLMFSLAYLLPQLLWIRKLRMNVLFTFLVSIIISIGMWYERIVIFITSLYRDYLPSSWSTDKASSLESFIELLAGWIAVLAVITFTYWRLYKRKKLPFKSAILAYSLFFISYFLSPCIHLFN